MPKPAWISSNNIFISQPILWILSTVVLVESILIIGRVYDFFAYSPAEQLVQQPVVNLSSFSQKKTNQQEAVMWIEMSEAFSSAQWLNLYVWTPKPVKSILARMIYQPEALTIAGIQSARSGWTAIPIESDYSLTAMAEVETGKIEISGSLSDFDSGKKLLAKIPIQAIHKNSSISFDFIPGIPTSSRVMDKQGKNILREPFTLQISKK